MGPLSEPVRLVRRGLDAVRLTDGVSVDAVLDALKAPGEILKESPKRITRRVGDWVVKASVAGGGVDVLKTLLQRRRRRRAWKAALHLQARGVGVAAPRAFVEHGMLGIVSGHSMVSDFLEGCVNVEVHGRGLAEKGGDVSSFLAGLAAAVNGLTDAGAYHGDLSGKNILTADGVGFSFIDLDGVLLGHSYGEAYRMKNHVQLYDSFCDAIGGEELEAFIVRMVPSDFDRGRWIAEVREGQRQRRGRQEAIWRKQGKGRS